MSSVTKSVTAADQWTDWISPVSKSKSGSNPVKHGHLAYSVGGSDWSATVTLQRTFDGGTTPLDVETYTEAGQGIIDDPSDDVKYRIGVASGNYSSGTIPVGLYQ